MNLETNKHFQFFL